MTVQPAEAPTIRLGILVGDMPEVPCESSTHGTVHQGGPASHYARVLCPDCGDTGVKAYCLEMVKVILRNWPTLCGKCDAIHPAQEAITILGPVNA